MDKLVAGFVWLGLARSNWYWMPGEEGHILLPVRPVKLQVTHKEFEFDGDEQLGFNAGVTVVESKGTFCFPVRGHPILGSISAQNRKAWCNTDSGGSNFSSSHSDNWPWLRTAHW